MLHASDILHQSRPFDRKSIIDKFSDLIYDILGQFKAEHLDRLIYSTDKHVPDKEDRKALIDGIIKGRCNSLQKMFTSLSINEQFYIVAHLNTDLLSTKVEEPSPIFVDLVCRVLYEAIAFGKYF